MNRPTNWSMNIHFQGQPINPLDTYQGGKLNRAQRRAFERKRKKAKKQ